MLNRVVSALGLLLKARLTVYTRIRNYALEAWQSFKAAPKVEKEERGTNTIIDRLWESHISNKKENYEGGLLSDLEIASEAADHLPAGVDTTSDTLTFLL